MYISYMRNQNGKYNRWRSEAKSTKCWVMGRGQHKFRCFTLTYPVTPFRGSVFTQLPSMVIFKLTSRDAMHMNSVHVKKK
jgi:hypothetical protein